MRPRAQRAGRVVELTEAIAIQWHPPVPRPEQVRTMPILLACACGKKLKVRDELAGKKVKCPACGAVTAAGVSDVVEAAPAARMAKGPPAPPPLPAQARDSDAPRDRAVGGEGHRSWRTEHFGTTRLLVAADDAVWFAKLDGDALEEAEEALERGEPPADVFGEAGASIPIASVAKVESNLHNSYFEVHYKTGKDDEETYQTFTFKDKERRTEALKHLRDVFGPDFEYQRRELTRFQAMLMPLGMIALTIGVFGFFVFLAWSLQQPGEGRIRTNILGLLAIYTVGWLGPIWTGAIGGLLVVLFVGWMVARILTPPIEVTLKPRPEDKRAAESGAAQDRPRKKRPRAEE